MTNFYKVDANFNIKTEKKIDATRKKKKSNIPLVKYVDIGYYIITPLLVGVFLGLVFDKFFGTKSVFFLIFLVLGTIGAFYNMYKIYKND